jgi:hypothetical protein
VLIEPDAVPKQLAGDGVKVTWGLGTTTTFSVEVPLQPLSFNDKTIGLVPGVDQYTLCGPAVFAVAGRPLVKFQE